MLELGFDLEAVEAKQSELVVLQTEINRLHARQAELINDLDPVMLRDLTGSRTVRDWLTATLDVVSATAMKLRQTGAAPLAVAEAFTSGVIGLDRAYLLTQLHETGLSEAELSERANHYSLGRLYIEWDRRRRVDQQTSQETFDDRYLIIQPTLDNSVHRFWGQAIGIDGEAILKAIGKRETGLPVLSDETRGQRQLDALASICLDSLTGTGAEGRAVTVAEVIIDGRLAAETNGEAGVTLATGPKVGPETLEEILCGGQARVITSGGHSVSYSDRGECIPPAIRLLVLNRDGQRCGIDGCGSQYRLQPHHIKPRSQGGNHHPENLITLCWYHHHVAIHGRGMELDPDSPTHRKRLRWSGTYQHAPPVLTLTAASPELK